MRQSALDESLSSIQAKCSPKENKFVFDNLVMLSREFQDTSTSKRDYDSILSGSFDTAEIVDENLPLAKKEA